MSANLVGMKPGAPAGPPSIRLTPQQLATMLVFEGAVARLQIDASQLGVFMKLNREAEALAKAANDINNVLTQLRAEWAGGIVVAQPSDVPVIQSVR